VSCAGNFNPDTVMGLLNHHLGSLRRGSEPELFSPPCFKADVALFPKDLSETHLCVGVEAPPFASEDRYAISILNTILGSSVSSRLFQEVREKKGFAYSIYSFSSSYIDTGFWAVYAGTGRKKTLTVTEQIIKEMQGLYSSITDLELRRAKDQLKGNIVLGLESTSSRMQSIARQEIYFGRNFSQSEIMKSIESVTMEQVRDLSYRLINSSNMCLTVLGRVKEEEFKDILTSGRAAT